MDKLFNLYLKELLEWNKKFNLTAITDPEEIRRKHFNESLALLRTSYWSQSHRPIGLKVIDVGAGAGFPGLPLKIACPEIKLTLLDATKKKTQFLKHIVKVLELKDVEIIWGRAEEVAQDLREQFDVAVSRAVAELRVLVEYCLPFVKVGGLFVAYKGEKAREEIKSAAKAIELLGGKLKQITEKPTLIVIEKIRPTPAKYPRRPGVAKKRPL